MLYGASQFKEYGVDVVFHKFTRTDRPRWWRALDVAAKILTCKESFDAVYATKQNGLDIIILLRSLGLFRKPIYLWLHQPVLEKKKPLLRKFARFYFRGIDHAFQFSESILERTLQSGIVQSGRISVCPWGADLKYYDSLMRQNPLSEHHGFISTGKEMRDMPTLVRAFDSTGAKLDIITAPACGDKNYECIFEQLEHSGNISVTINRGMWIPELATIIWPHECICICCLESNYTVGLTTLVEALAFGLPVIVSANPNFPFDVEKEGCGISVAYGDVQGWRNAIEFIRTHPLDAAQMGKRGRALAESVFNIETCALTVCHEIGFV